MDEPQTSRLSKPTKLLITLAGGVVVLMLGTMAIVNGFWTDNFQRVSHQFHRLIQIPSISAGSRDKNLNEKAGSPFAREGLTPQEPSGSGHLASTSLPAGFGKIDIEAETSPKVKQPSPPPPANSEIQPESPGEAKPSTQIAKEGPGEPQEKLSPSQVGAATASSPPPAPPAQVSSASKVVVQAGDGLTGIVERNYPENPKVCLLAVLLANPAIDREDIIHPGQVLELPEVNFAKQTIRLRNNLLYAIYGTYLSKDNLKEDTAWLVKKNVHFVVRDTKDYRGKTVHRVFLGGYATEQELEKALADVKTKAR